MIFVFFPSATRLFCDVYNPQSKTYCKRLQVLCPEHSRDPKVRFYTLIQQFISDLLYETTFKLFINVLTTILLIHHNCGSAVCRFQQMRCVDVLWCVTSLSPRASTAECRNASATNTTAGRNSAGPRWTWREFEWLVSLCY